MGTCSCTQPAEPWCSDQETRCCSRTDIPRRHPMSCGEVPAGSGTIFCAPSQPSRGPTRREKSLARGESTRTAVGSHSHKNTKMKKSKPYPVELFPKTRLGRVTQPLRHNACRDRGCPVPSACVCCELLYKAIECRAEARMLHASSHARRLRTAIEDPSLLGLPAKDSPLM